MSLAPDRTRYDGPSLARRVTCHFAVRTHLEAQPADPVADLGFHGEHMGIAVVCGEPLIAVLIGRKGLARERAGRTDVNAIAAIAATRFDR